MSKAGDIADLRGLGTEQIRPELAELDLLPVERLVSLMCADVQRVPDAVSAVEAAIVRAVEGVVERLERGGRLIYIGAGSAGRLGMLDAAEAGPTFNVPLGQVVGVLAGGSGAFEVPVENAEDDRAGGIAAIEGLGVSADDVVIGIAASGRTPYVLGAVTAANEAGALTVGLACNAGTPLGAAAHVAIEVLVGPEIIAGSTRLNAGTAQKVVLNIISTAAMVRLGKTYGGLMVELRATNEKLRARASRIVAEIADVPLERARAALEQAEWRPKTAAAMLVGGVDAETAARVLERHRGRLRPVLEELAAPNVAREQKRLGVAAACIDGVLVPGDVAIAGDRICGIGLSGRGSGLAIPALVDAQVNGYGGIDVISAEPEELVELGQALIRDGVTAYLPTLITADPDDVLRALRRIAALADRHASASVIGVHLEGPFLSHARPGTHPREHLRAPDLGLLERLLDGGPVRMVTLAPELPGAAALIELCVRRGVVVSFGHSEASAGDAARGFAAGASAVTHLFNAMAPIGGRAPGLAGAALATGGIAIQLIADGVHLSDELIRVAFQAAPGRCSLVSDAVAAAGLGDGDYRLGAVEIEVRGGVARRADGTLAGSTGRLCEGLVRLGRLGIDRLDAIAAVTARPAALLGASRFGTLELGGSADVLVIDDELALQRVVAAGIDVDR
ncbi:MAG: N-acetylmuramic acid 6-phosphate etherase [Gaiellales bacterium]|nr:N-acetylmuramic acid 6-phosphate etherase [Gaiellales bacterium]